MKGRHIHNHIVSHPLMSEIPRILIAASHQTHLSPVCDNNTRIMDIGWTLFLSYWLRDTTVSIYYVFKVSPGVTLSVLKQFFIRILKSGLTICKKCNFSPLIQAMLLRPCSGTVRIRYVRTLLSLFASRIFFKLLLRLFSNRPFEGNDVFFVSTTYFHNSTRWIWTQEKILTLLSRLSCSL
jgi:hypothetical protein